MARFILIFLFPTLLFATELVDFEGFYRLAHPSLDSGEGIQRECYDVLGIVYKEEENAIESNIYSFYKINEGPYRMAGESDKGERETLFSENTVVSHYRFQSLFISDWERRSLTLHEGGDVITVRRDAANVRANLTCIYNRYR